MVDASRCNRPLAIACHPDLHHPDLYSSLGAQDQAPLRVGVPIALPQNDPKGVKLLCLPTDASEQVLVPSYEDAGSFFGIK